ncbi:MAG TPA: hypothetical protein PLZ74_11165 [Kiritimatiellia bacterium]|nr:hypothetical protein [Kiritimatiellia bacterium]
MAECIYYRKGYKYQLAEDDVSYTAIRPVADIVTDFIELTKEGRLLIRKAYAWDGCSGCAIDDKTNMRGGLRHDAKYQLMRLGLLPPEDREIADIELREDCLDAGMWKIRAWYYFEGVDHFAEFAARYGYEPYPILIAP